MAPLASTQCFALADRVVLQTDGVEAVALRLSDETAFALNHSAARIAELLAAGHSVAAAADALCSEYALTPEAAASSVAKVARALLGRRLLVLLSDGETA